VQQEGPARDVVAEYLQVSDAIRSLPLAERIDRSGAGRFGFEELTILNAKGERRDFAVTGEDLTIRLRLATPGLDAPCPPSSTSPSLSATTRAAYHGAGVVLHGEQSHERRRRTRSDLHCATPPLLAGHIPSRTLVATSSETQDCSRTRRSCVSSRQLLREYEGRPPARAEKPAAS